MNLPMHPEKVTVWCGLWAGGIIGPYFFKDAANRNVTVNGERYREMIDRCKSLICTTCGFNKTVPLGTLCSVNILFHVRDRSFGRLDRAI